MIKSGTIRRFLLSSVLGVLSFDFSNTSFASELERDSKTLGNIHVQGSGNAKVIGYADHVKADTLNQGGQGGKVELHNHYGDASPKTYDEYYSEGMRFKKLNQYEEAAIVFFSATQIVEKNQKINAYLNLAECQQKLKKVDEALISYKNVLEYDPRDDRALRGLMKIHYDNGCKSKQKKIKKDNLTKALQYGEKIDNAHDSDEEITEEIKQKLYQLQEGSEIDSIANSVQQMALKPSASGKRATQPVQTTLIERPIGRTIPSIARGYEAIYERFINGKLIYKPYLNSDTGKREFPFSQFTNTLNGEFNLSGLTFEADGDTYSVDQYLRIKVGFRTVQENEAKTTVWVVPKFMVDQSNSAFKDVQWASDVGLFWSWGESNLMQFDYLTTKQFDEISSTNLREIAPGVYARGGEYALGRARRVDVARRFYIYF